MANDVMGQTVVLYWQVTDALEVESWSILRGKSHHSHHNRPEEHGFGHGQKKKAAAEHTDSRETSQSGLICDVTR